MPKEKFGVINHYTCPQCGYCWEDEWDCEVDDDCPTCGERHISPEEPEVVIEEN